MPIRVGGMPDVYPALTGQISCGVPPDRAPGPQQEVTGTMSLSAGPLPDPVAAGAPAAGTGSATVNPAPAGGTRALRVLRLASVFAVPEHLLTEEIAGYDPVGGMQNHTGQLSAELDRLGVAQTIVTAYRPGVARAEPLGGCGRVLRVGIRTRRLRQGYGPAAARALGVLPGPFDLVHAHLGEDAAVLSVALAAARRWETPLVVTVHLSPRHTLAVNGLRSVFLRMVGGTMEQLAIRRAAAVITLTERLAAAACASGVAADRVHVIPSGVRPALFGRPEAGSAARPAVAGSGRTVLFVGRLHRQKGVDVLVRAIPLLPGDVRVVLVGDGPERARLCRLAADLGVADRVRVTGFVPHAQVPELLAGADVAVLPSRYEELGTALVEAMAAGRPVVAAAVGGIPELVRDRLDGRLVAPGDPAALAAALTEVLDDPELAGSWAASARARVAGHDWALLARRTLEVYRTVTAAR